MSKGVALKDRICAELEEYDGKSPTILSEIAARHGGKRSFLDAVIALCADNDGTVANGATWIVKHHLDEGGALTRKRTEALVAACPSVTDWMAQLHICQSISRLALPPAQARLLAPWLEPLLTHKRPFLRAWSLDALCALAALDETIAKQAGRALAAAGEDRAASVRARARNIKLA